MGLGPVLSLMSGRGGSCCWDSCPTYTYSPGVDHHWRSGHRLLSHGCMVWPQNPFVCKALGKEEVLFISLRGSGPSPWEGMVLSGLGVSYFLLPVLCVGSLGSVIMWTVIRRNTWVLVYHSQCDAPLVTQHALHKCSLEDSEGDQEGKKVVFLPMAWEPSLKRWNVLGWLYPCLLCWGWAGWPWLVLRDFWHNSDSLNTNVAPQMSCSCLHLLFPILMLSNSDVSHFPARALGHVCLHAQPRTHSAACDIGFFGLSHARSPKLWKSLSKPQQAVHLLQIGLVPAVSLGMQVAREWCCSR